MPTRPGAEVLASGLGAAVTDTLFNPLEMLKATWVRSFCVTGLRVGLYPTVKALVGADSLGQKLAAGAATGALSSALANPIDMVGLPMRYASTAAAALSIVRGEGGVGSLWRGLGATAARQALLSSGQLASYDGLKQAARSAGATEGTPLHVCCAAASGFIGQLFCMPADVLKVKVLSGDHGSASACLRHTLQHEGAAGLYRGFLPAVVRQCPVILVQMPLIEQIRCVAGLGHI